MPRKEEPFRECALTRESKPTGELIRFVVGPDDVLVPDIDAKAEGRGVWVTATIDAVAEAVKKKAFAKSLKSAVTLPDDRDIVVVRAFDAPRPLVFDAWTKPALVQRWLGSPGWLKRCVDCQVRNVQEKRSCGVLSNKGHGSFVNEIGEIPFTPHGLQSVAHCISAVVVGVVVVVAVS